MAIEFNKEQYKELVHSLQVAETIYALLRDMVDRKKYDKKLKQIEDLSEYTLKLANDYGMSNITEDFEGKKVVSEKYLDEIMDDLREYDDYAFWEELARRFARKEIFNTYSEEQIRNMDEKELICKQIEIEDKYWKEFEKYGIDHLEIKR